MKYLPYDALSAIPEKIVIARKRKQRGQRAYARLIHDELLIQFLLTFCWRQRNIRECRLGFLEKDNISKEGFSHLVNVAKPQWIIEELERNPQALFWQFYFREDETKIGREVRGAVPSHIIPLLEEYLEYHRPLLVGNNDPGTLFVNRTGGVLVDEEVMECPATFVPVEMRQTGMRGTDYGTRKEAYGGADREPAATG